MATTSTFPKATTTSPSQKMFKTNQGQSKIAPAGFKTALSLPKTVIKGSTVPNYRKETTKYPIYKVTTLKTSEGQTKTAATGFNSKQKFAKTQAQLASKRSVISAMPRKTTVATTMAATTVPASTVITAPRTMRSKMTNISTRYTGYDQSTIRSRRNESIAGTGVTIKFKITRRCVAVTGSIIVALLLALSLVLYFVFGEQSSVSGETEVATGEPVTGETDISRTPLVPLDSYCKSFYKECAYYRKKFVDNCSREDDFCSTTKIVVELNMVDFAPWGPGFKTNLVFSTPSQRMTIPDGAPCLMPGKLEGEKGAVGLCNKGQCFASTNRSVLEYMAQSSINGNWSSLTVPETVDDVPCLDTSRVPPVLKEYWKRFQRCTSYRNCSRFYMQYRSCTNPSPALGGNGCIQNLSLVDKHAITPSINFPMAWTECRECGAELPDVPSLLCHRDQLDRQCIFLVSMSTADLGAVASNAADDQWLAGRQRASRLFYCCIDYPNLGGCLAGTCIS